MLRIHAAPFLKTMKQLIIEALQSVDTNKGIAKTKNVSTFLSIEGLTVAELQQFIKDKDVPDNAVLTCHTDWQGDYIQNAEAALEWTEQIPTTEKEQDIQRRINFKNRAWKLVYDKLTSNGYKRCGGGAYQKFKGVDLYDLYVSGDFDTLTEYYGLFFKPL